MLTALLCDLEGAWTETATLPLQALRTRLHTQAVRERTQAQFDERISGRANGLLFKELFPQAIADQC